MKTSFLGFAYQSRSPIMASQTAINIYPELVEVEGSEVGGFIGTPGLILQTGLSLPGYEVRGMRAVGNYLYAVIGASVYQYSLTFVSVLVGTLPNSTGPVSITDNGLQVCIAHADGWFVITISSLAVNSSVTNAPIDSIVTFIDGYGLFTRSIGGTFGITALYDFTTIDPLNVATAEGSPDDLISVIADHREAWLFGTTSTEVWGNTGSAFFPYERVPGGFIDQGCIARRSPAKADNSVFWLSRNTAGKGIVCRSNGYQWVRISTHAIEYAINQYSDITDAIGFTYQQEGHEFYVLTFPTGDATWVYDCSTKGWHQRKSFKDDGYLHRWKANCHVHFNNMNLVGDNFGNIYKLDLDTYTDGTLLSGPAAIYRERAWELPDNENKKTRVDSVELIAMVGDGDTVDPAGTNPIVSLECSINAGIDFSYKKQRPTGLIGQTTKRAKWRRCGAGRNWVLRVSTTMNARVHWIGANINAEGLEL